MLYFAPAILSIGSAHPIEFPVSAVATLCLYLFAADLCWTLSSQSIPMRLAGAAGAVLLLGYGVPAAVNAGVSGLSREAASADAIPASVGTPEVIALLTPYRQKGGKWQVEADCEILCQRLLYKGDRKAVLMGSTPPSGTPGAATGLVRYSIERRSTCPPVKVPEASVMPGQMQYGNSNATSESVQSRIDMGECLIAQPGAISEADGVAVKSKPDFGDPLRAGHSAGPVVAWRSTVFHRIDAGSSKAGWVKVGQATDRGFSRVRSPLRVRLNGLVPSLLDSRNDVARSSDPDMIEHMLAPWLAWPQGMPGGSAGPPPSPLPAGSS
ncbi:MAG: hypothetical protein ABI240_09445 [Sphingomonas sp.]